MVTLSEVFSGDVPPDVQAIGSYVVKTRAEVYGISESNRWHFGLNWEDVVDELPPKTLEYRDCEKTIKLVGGFPKDTYKLGSAYLYG